ncbi:MAG: hypothetical protein ACSLFM_13630 [Tepidiformaceae bacterium]
MPFDAPLGTNGCTKQSRFSIEPLRQAGTAHRSEQGDEMRQGGGQCHRRGESEEATGRRLRKWCLGTYEPDESKLCVPLTDSRRRRSQGWHGRGCGDRLEKVTAFRSAPQCVIVRRAFGSECCNAHELAYLRERSEAPTDRPQQQAPQDIAVPLMCTLVKQGGAELIGTQAPNGFRTREDNGTKQPRSE